MDWNSTLQHCYIDDLRKQILINSDSWSSFTNSEGMKVFLESIIESSNTQDVRFKRDCINFIIDVFPLSSDVIRECLLSSQIMQGVYGMLSNGQQEGFEEIINYSKTKHIWGDLKSGLVIFGRDCLLFQPLCDFVGCINEKELCQLVDNGLVAKDLLDPFLCNRGYWNNWDLAMKIIRKCPESLRYQCFTDAAMRQPEKIINELSAINGIDKQSIRTIVINKGVINDWILALRYLKQGILTSSDAVFKKIAVKQGCNELFMNYDGKFIKGVDLKDIISQKGYWDDWNSVNQLQQEGILDIAEEQIFLSALEKSDQQSVMSSILENRELLSRLIDNWQKNSSLCPSFPSLCWDALLARFVQRGINRDSNGIDYANLRDTLADLTDEIALKVFFIRLYTLNEESYVFSLIDAIERGTLVSPQFINDYHSITNSTSYIPIRTIVSFRKKYHRDIGIALVAKNLCLFSSDQQSIISSISNVFSDDDKTLWEKLNDGFFKQIDNNAKDLLGTFYNSYEKLNKEQRRAVLTDEESSLVISSAGSGKTRVIVSKYAYLSTAKGVDKNKIRILAYTRATRKEINQDKLRLDPENGPARTFHSFANEIIVLSGKHPQYLRDVQQAATGNDIDHSPRAATLYQMMKDNGIEKDDTFMNALSLYAVSYKSRDRNNNLSFYTDRNGKIGSLKSYQEKVIFDFLADNNVDFAYEELSEDGKARPDFTIYSDEKKYYYEHFATDDKISYSPYGEQYLDDAKRKIKQWGDKLIYTTGAGINDSEVILDQLKSKLASINVSLNRISPEKRTEILRTKNDYDLIFQSGIKMCLDIYDIIRETKIPINEAYTRCESNEYANTFMTVLFKNVMEYYKKLLEPEGNAERIVDYTGCIEYAAELCNKKIINDFKWDYVLIDEYQDISPLRLEFIKSLRVVNPKLKICAVGDDWQSIYSFANSDLSRFKNFEEDWPDSKTLMMTETFRFNEPLLSVSTSFLKVEKDPLLIEKIVRPSKSAPEKTNIEIKECTDINHQVSFIQRIIKDKELKPKDYFILARFKSDLDYVRRKINNDNEDCFMTMHASKGLTKEYVFLVNCNSNTIPSQVKDDTTIMLIRQADNDAKIKEERRLFYVAITRASKKTFVLYSGLPSVFVNDLANLTKE